MLIAAVDGFSQDWSTLRELRGSHGLSEVWILVRGRKPDLLAAPYVS